MAQIQQTMFLAIKRLKKGELQNAYSPLLNLINTKNLLGDFTTTNLNFDRYTPVDMLITDEYDGSENIIINDDKNNPKLINSRFSVLENNTYNIPEHSGNKVTNVYEDATFDKDTQLMKLYDTIPTLTFEGLHDGGAFNCGSYTFYFKLGDSDGNNTSIVQESSVVQIHMGQVGSSKIRMGMQDENAEKSVKFLLTNIDNGFDYVRVYYERSTTDNSELKSINYFKINEKFPIKKGKCAITLTGEEDITQTTLLEIQTEYADIATAKTQAVVDNMLFLGNISAHELDYQLLLLIAWKIIPSVTSVDINGSVGTQDYNLSGDAMYYDINNVYNNTGYWADEYYRFGVVFIYNNNLLSHVYNIQGCDLSADLTDSDFFLSDGRKWENEPDDFFFNKKDGKMLNSKGVVKFPTKEQIKMLNGSVSATCLKIRFDFANIPYKYINGIAGDLNLYEDLIANLYTEHSPKALLQAMGIKGFFFVRLKRKPTIIALGMVVGLTGKDYGSIPVLRNSSNKYITKSFLSSQRLLLNYGSSVLIKDANVSKKALLVPDYEVNEATLNQVFNGLKFLLSRVGSVTNKINEDHHYANEYKTLLKDKIVNNVMLTGVPKETKIISDGTNYFSTMAGNPSEAFRTADVNNKWSTTKPLNLTVSNSLIRGNWGSYVGMSTGAFNYGDIVNIKLNCFKNADQNELEFLSRFKDYSLYSSISQRYNVKSKLSGNLHTIDCAQGDCFLSVFTHRMMSNFIDPELPTNRKIIDPGCWSLNYLVRCTAEILSTASSNMSGESSGFYIPNPARKKSSVIGLIMGILSGSVAKIVSSISDMGKSDAKQDKYANEVTLAFEIYIGKAIGPSGTKISDGQGYKDKFLADSDSGVSSTTSLKKLCKKNKIKKVEPKELESQGGFNLKAIFKSDNKWEMHGLASINRADVNAVSFGSWITFPICSRFNLALRDIDYSNTTELASMNRKRSFYPYEAMDEQNHLLESGVINGAANKTISTNGHYFYTTVPYIKLEFFNRIYWSKPNVASDFINSYRMIYDGLFKEYNKEYGSITKLIPLDNALLVVFDHGIIQLPVSRDAKTEQQASPYFASTNVLPSQGAPYSKDYGSMWKDSVIQTPKGIVYGVDTIAKKIWRIVPGQGFGFISEWKVGKFLNDNINLTEYNFNEYQGHINVKSHYNEFKHDVMFTFYHDTPMTWHHFLLNEVNGSYECVPKGITEGEKDSSTGINIWNWIYYNETGDKCIYTTDEDYVNNASAEHTALDVLTEVDLSGNLILDDTIDPKPLIDSWEDGKIWSLCYNEVLDTFITFYDWYPVESCNVDNIFFSFDRDAIDKTYNNDTSDRNWEFATLPGTPKTYPKCKSIIDKAFTNNATVSIYPYSSYGNGILFLYTVPSEKSVDDLYFSFYYYNNRLNSYKGTDFSGNGWYFVVLNKDTDPNNVGGIIWDTAANTITIPYAGSANILLAEPKFTYLTSTEVSEMNKVTDGSIYKYYDLRNSETNRMYLWKHGQAGLYTCQSKIKPTFWYGKQHEFNFEFIVNEQASILKIFTNLKMISNKTAPNKFEYEVVGEGYGWYEYKPIIEWINENSSNSTEFDNHYKTILSNTYADLKKDVSSVYASLPDLFDENRIIKKLPYLHIELCDRKGRLDKSYHLDTDYWDNLDKTNIKKDQFSYNCSETILVEDEQLNELRVHTESLGNDMKKYGRLRGNMQYLEDLWDIEIRPVLFTWAYVENEELKFKKLAETRHRDKYLKVKVRYTGKDLAVIQAVMTMFNYSFA